MSWEADSGRDDEGNLIRRVNLDNLDAAQTIGIDEDLSQGQEVANGAVVMGADKRGGVGIGTAS